MQPPIWRLHIRSVMQFYILAVLTPIVMNALEKRRFLTRYPWSVAPIQLALLGVCLTFATPMCCALFSQRASIPVSSLEPELQVSQGESNSWQQQFHAQVHNGH
jgi:hypothetical protein